MKVLYNWLKEFVPLDIGADEAAAALSRLGFEVASVQKFGGRIANVVTAEVRNCAKHPNADRLTVCTIFDGTGEFQVVCGAPNVRAGLRVALARVGALLPKGEALKAAKIRGVESNGMLCSSSELGIEGSSEGILELDSVVPLGQDIRVALGMDDALIDIEITPNRRDTLCVIGLARELAASLSLPLKTPEPRARVVEISQGVSLVNEAPDQCPRYIARYFRDVRVGPSPAWIAQRLQRCGIRSINNVVDITNYVMLELGQPLHAFDAGKIEGRQIRVRRAKSGEALLLLDGRTVELKEEILVIADAVRPAAIAGVMGGEDSAVTERTREVILESAAFTPALIRKTSKALGASTESSYRFERGTDWAMVEFASRRAAQMLQELAGAIGFKPVEYAAHLAPVAPIKLRTDRMRQFLGVDLKEAVAAGILRRLGCVISTGTAQLAVTVPSWRLDLTSEADLTEEIARLYGYDHIPVRLPTIRLTTVPDDTLWSFERQAAAVLNGLGISEACNTSLQSTALASPFVPGFGQPADAAAVSIANPLSQEQAVLRTSLLPGLFQNAQLNFHRQATGVKLFELGRVFFQDQEGRHERRRMGLLMAGIAQDTHWRVKERATDFFDLSGALESFLRALRIPRWELSPWRAAVFHPHQSCVILSGEQVVGWMGTLHPELQHALGLSGPVLAAEFESAMLMRLAHSTAAYERPSSFPPVRRDLSFVVPLSVTYEKISKTLRSAGGETLESIALVDLYHGDKIGTANKSLTVSLSFRRRDRTLNDTEVEKWMVRLVTELDNKCGATLRS